MLVFSFTAACVIVMVSLVQQRSAMIAQQATIRRHLQALKFVDAGDVVKDLTSVCILVHCYSASKSWLASATSKPKPETPQTLLKPQIF